MSPSIAILAALLLPLLCAVLVVLCGPDSRLRSGAILATASATFAIVCWLAPVVAAGDRPSVNLFEVFPDVWLGFSLEPLGILFALVASGLWIVTSVYSFGYMQKHGQGNETRFYACFAVAIFAAIGVAFARNLLTLFAFYEVLTLSTWPLVTHDGTPEARRAGRVYLGVLLGTSVLGLLAAVLWTWALAGTLEFRPGGILAGKVDSTTATLLLLLFAFGTGKAALMPLHRWLPAAMVAPTPVSALLHAVAVVKAGVFTVLKVAVYIFGRDVFLETGAGKPVMAIAAVTVLVASLVALAQDNLKARLAYSTISQLAYVVLGAMLASLSGVVGAGMHIAMHAMGKITLFFCAGAIYIVTHKTRVSELDGIGRTMPLTMFAFLLGSLSVIGLPPFGGSWSKWLLVHGAAESGHPALVAVLLISTLLNIAYLMPIVVRGFFLAPLAPDEISGEHVRNEPPLLCLVPLCVTAVGGLVLFFFADAIYRLLVPILP